MVQLMKHIAHLLQRGKPLALATILQQDGSTPRTAGARMIIRDDGASEGTIGGGLAEAMAQQRGRELLDASGDEHSCILDVDMSSRGPGDMDMICGGSLEILVELLVPSPQTTTVFVAASEAIRSGCTVLFATHLPGGGSRPDHCVLIRQPDSANISPKACDGPVPEGSVLSKILDAAVESPWAITPSADDGSRWLVETLAPPDSVYLFGAGHVAQATAVVAAQADFSVTVLDDRSEFANRKRYPHARRVVVLDSFEDIFESPELARDHVGPGSYLVIVTRGHSHDGLVLRQALGTEAGYIGMIGSRSKCETVFRRMREEGFTDADLARVHSPIGLDIGAQTPGEIAVSIVAQLIQHRRQGA